MPRDYPEYEDESTEETYRDPLKPFLIALVVLLLLFAAIIVLLYMRLQTANTRAETLSQELTAVQVQLDDLRAQRAAETPTPTPTEAPTPTPEPTPEPTATPDIAICRNQSREFAFLLSVIRSRIAETVNLNVQYLSSAYFAIFSLSRVSQS